MDRRIRRLGIGLVVLFALLFAQLSYVQVIAADDIKAQPANARRQIIAEYRVERGPILSADGELLAHSVRNQERRSELLFRRVYPDGPLYAGLTGYYSRIYAPARAGGQPVPVGRRARARGVDVHRPDPRAGAQGGAVFTTIRSDLQEAAALALGDLPGAVVAVEPETGDVLALVANPSYDPNSISSGTDEITEAWEAISTDPEQPLISRAKDELYLPGSTGKLITASAALENGVDPVTDQWPNPRVLDLPQTTNTLENFGGSLCNGGSQTVSMAEAFQESCNVTFAEIGLDLGAKEMSEQALAYGFCPTDPPTQVECEEPTIPFVLPWANGRFPVPSYFARPAAAARVFGDRARQRAHEPAAHGADAAIANDGVMMQPRLITEVRDPTGKPVRRSPRNSTANRSATSAKEMRAMMLSVTQGGTASSAFAASPSRWRARPARPRTGRTGHPTPGSRRSLRPDRVTRPASPWRLSFSTAETSGTRPPADGCRHRSRAGDRCVSGHEVETAMGVTR